MLKGIPDILGADALWLLAAMGHGDRLAIVDRNYPAHSVHSRTVTLAGVDAVQAVTAIATLFPLDTFVDAAAHGMVPDGEPGAVLESHGLVAQALTAAEGRPIELAPIERSEFYPTARAAFGAIVTSESRPFSCFLLTKGVVFPESGA